MKPANYKVDGFEIGLSRRRYGSTTYTWVSVNVMGEHISCGDPWPCITPKRAEVESAARQAILNYIKTKDKTDEQR